MKNLTSRAIAILTGNEAMIKKLHVLEISQRYCVPACNVAELFGNDSIKAFYSVPEDDKKISRWTHECETKINNFLGNDEQFNCLFSTIDVEKVHEFDWKCYMNRSHLSFAYNWQKDKPEETLINKFDKKEPIAAGDTTRKDLWGKV